MRVKVVPAVVSTEIADSIVAVPARLVEAVMTLAAPKAIVPPVSVGVPSSKVMFPEA
jgi:hypothetical protein